MHLSNLLDKPRQPGGGARHCYCHLLPMRFDAWWQEPWLSNALRPSIRPRSAFISPCSFARVLKHWFSVFALRLTRGMMRQSSPSKVAMRTAASHAHRSLQLLPFARLFYGQASAYCWCNAVGNLRAIRRSEPFEQGDPLAPALFTLGQHESPGRAAKAVHPFDCPMIFLDDLYLLTVPDRFPS